MCKNIKQSSAVCCQRHMGPLRSAFPLLWFSPCLDGVSNIIHTPHTVSFEALAGVNHFYLCKVDWIEPFLPNLPKTAVCVVSCKWHMASFIPEHIPWSQPLYLIVLFPLPIFPETLILFWNLPPFPTRQTLPFFSPPPPPQIFFLNCLPSVLRRKDRFQGQPICQCYEYCWTHFAWPQSTAGIQFYFVNQNTHTKFHSLGRQTYSDQKGHMGVGGLDWGFGIGLCTLWYMKWLASLDLLCGTEKSTQYSVIIYVGKESEKEWMCGRV